MKHDKGQAESGGQVFHTESLTENVWVGKREWGVGGSGNPAHRSIGAKGGKPSVDVVRFKELRDSGMGGSAIAKEMGIGRASVYRALQG